MNGVRRFGAFWWDFIVGDDWRLALGVAVGLAVTVLLVHVGHVDVWWLLPAVVIGMLSASVLLATRRPPG